MRKDTVIYSCPSCDHWEWGSEHCQPETCPDCGADMADSEPDRRAALDTHWCREYHRRKEERGPAMVRI